MPRACLKPCKFGGCPNLTDRRDNLCEEHAKDVMSNYNRFERDRETSRRYRRAWEKIRDRYLLTHPICEMCERDGRLTPAALVHHKLPLRDGGTNGTENLQALCAACHEKHHNQTGGRFGGGKRVFTY